MNEKDRNQYIEEIERLRAQIKTLEKIVFDYKQAELTIQEAREYAESVIDTVREPLLVLNADLRVITVNRAFCRVFRVKPEKTEKQLIYDLGNRQWDIPKLREFLEKILPHRTTFDNFEVEHEFPVIGKRVMLLNAREIYGKEKESKMILLAMEDITAIRRLEKMKDLLTQMIIHDLSNPLAVISLNVQHLGMQLQSALSAKLKKSFYLTLYNVQEMKNMISNLLDISKMEEGEFALRCEEVQFDATVKEITDSMKILAQLDEKVISVRTPPTLPSLHADRDVLKRVISNLIGNALKFSPSDSTIEVVVWHDKDSKEVVVSVKDQSKGIRKENLQRIFEKFVQLDSAGRREIVGKGLGLTFSKMAVEAHGGRIWVESEIDKGNIFYFTLPVIEKSSVV
jgi:signal transduction histidine kinase